MRVLALIGHGASSVMMSGWDPKTRHPVALKFLEIPTALLRNAERSGRRGRQGRAALAIFTIGLLLATSIGTWAEDAPLPKSSPQQKSQQPRSELFSDHAVRELQGSTLQNP